MSSKTKSVTAVLIVLALVAGVGMTKVGSKYKTQDKVNLIFANATSNSAKKAGEKFKELVEEYSDGDITVDLGFDGKAAQEMLKGVSKVGLKHMAMWENGFRNCTNNDHAIETPADCKGQKIRTMENPIHLKAWKSIGANPTPMAFSELFTAMQQGTVDGEENPIGIIYSNRFYEVQKYISLTQHVYTPYVVFMNPDKYDSLTDEQQEIIDKAMKEASAYQLEVSAKDEEEGLKEMEKYGCEVNTLTDDQKKEFQKLIEDADVFSLAKSSMEHPEYFDEIQKELTQYREEGK